MKPTSQKVLEYTNNISASSEAVFRVIFDPLSKLLWVPAIGCVEIESDRPLGLETPYLASAGIGLLKFVFREQIMEWVENRRVAYGGRSLWANLKQKRISICARVGLDCTPFRLHFHRWQNRSLVWQVTHCFVSPAGRSRDCGAIQGSYRKKSLAIGK